MYDNKTQKEIVNDPVRIQIDYVAQAVAMHLSLTDMISDLQCECASIAEMLKAPPITEKGRQARTFRCTEYYRSLEETLKAMTENGHQLVTIIENVVEQLGCRTLMGEIVSGIIVTRKDGNDGC